MCRETVLNKESKQTVMNDISERCGSEETRLNPILGHSNDGEIHDGVDNGCGMAGSTVYNAYANNETQLNQQALMEDTLHKGSQVGDYLITEQLSVKTGEADLYRCVANGDNYVLKLYRREAAVKEEILEQLKSIDSPYIAKLVDTGYYNQRPYEIIPYYEKGSINGKMYSFEELQKTIIPELNEALNVLHSRNIIHKDLKPSNIMLCDNGKDIALIDFGISSIKEDGNTMILTKTGFTPDYTAHEAFNGLFLNESDYYSLGITLFELYTGTTPYKDMSAEQIAMYTSVQKIPLPENMEQELKDLIASLTYYDITNRKDKSNPNRRWTYVEVKNWCDGIKQPIPGVAAKHGEECHFDSMESYRFMGIEYTDRHKLAIAFSQNWNEAKKDLFNGMLTARFKATDQEFAKACIEAEEAYGTGINSDLLFFKILYKLDSSLEDFIWKGRQFNSLEALGKDTQDRLWKEKKPNMSLVNDILKNRVLSAYLDSMDNTTEEMKKSVQALENSFIQNYHDYRQRKMNYYLLGYLLSGRRVFYKNDREFESVEQLVAYLQELIQISYKNFEEYCESLIDSENKLDEQFETWLMALGKNDQIISWRKKLS